MSMTALIITGFVIVALFLFLRKRKSDPDEASTAARPESSGASEQFHAVSIRFVQSACTAAKEMDGKRFLSSAAPRLPLPDCDVLECKCKFVHHKDRRDGDDRRSPFHGGISSSSSGEYESEQRGYGDRRADPPDAVTSRNCSCTYIGNQPQIWVRLEWFGAKVRPL